WLFIIPAALLVREPPASVTAGLPGAATAADDPGLTAGQALRTPQFAAIAFTYFACCAAHSGPIFHMVTHAIDHGVPAIAAATVLSVAGLASLSGKILCGLVADRVGAKRVLLAGLALQAVAITFYLGTSELWHFYGAALVFGFAYGGVMPLYAILVREYFGARIMGTIFGAVGIDDDRAVGLEEDRDLLLRLDGLDCGGSSDVGQERVRILWRERIGRPHEIVAEEGRAIGEIAGAEDR